MRTPAERGTYHVVHFADGHEAASFVAALSRFLASPRWHAPPGHAEIEVWSDARAAADGVALYLSDGALAATATGFAAPPVAGSRRGSELPSECALLYDPDAVAAMGTDDAAPRLTDR